MKCIKQMYNDGHSPESISEKYPQYSPYIIRECLRKNGWLKQWHVITDEILDKMIYDYEQGMNFTELSQKYEFHAVTIANKIRKYGKNKNKYYPKVARERVMKVISDMNLKLLKDFSDNSINTQTLHVYDDHGYKYVTTWTLLRQKHRPLRYSPRNPYSIENINVLLNDIRNGEYYCPLGQEYKGNNNDLIFVHKPCGTHFVSTLVAMQGKQIGQHYKYYKHCQICYPEKIESTHASVLKQVFLHEYPSTTTEDKSCMNPDTRRALPTDIVNHNLKIVVEVQSSYHDDPDKQRLDNIKKQYWLNKGYQYYCPDIRDYDVLEMVQLFFPKIKRIPDYIDYHYSDIIDYHLVQSYLDQGETVKDVAHKLNLQVYQIHNSISRGLVALPEQSKRKAMDAKGLVHLDKEGNFIKEYEFLNDVSKDNYALGTIQRVLRGQQKFAYDSYWVYSSNYYSGNYQIPTEDPDRYMVSITMYYKDIIKTYDNIYDASNDINCYPYEIYQVVMGKRKSFRGYTFRFNH